MSQQYPGRPPHLSGTLEQTWNKYYLLMQQEGIDPSSQALVIANPTPEQTNEIAALASTLGATYANRPEGLSVQLVMEQPSGNPGSGTIVDTPDQLVSKVTRFAFA